MLKCICLARGFKKKNLRKKRQLLPAPPLQLQDRQQQGLCSHTATGHCGIDVRMCAPAQRWLQGCVRAWMYAQTSMWFLEMHRQHMHMRVLPQLLQRPTKPSPNVPTGWSSVCDGCWLLAAGRRWLRWLRWLRCSLRLLRACALVRTTFHF